jgi:hypothetical protein
MENLPTAIINGLKELFIPDEDFFDEFVDLFNEKFGFVSQIIDLGRHLFDMDYSGSPPDVEITFYGVTFNFIDFSIYNQYRLWIHAIIAGFVWFHFIRRLFKTRIPQIIGGMS